MSTARTVHSSRRRGYGLFELAVATVLLGVAMAIVAQTVGWLAAERRGAQRRQRAVQEAANLMERLNARPWDELTPDLARAQVLSPSTKALLRDGDLSVSIDAEPGSPTTRRVAIRIAWGDRSAGLVAPVQLVAWVHQRDREGGRP